MTRHAEAREPCGTAEIGQIDDEGGADHVGLELAQELDRGLRRSAVAIKSSTSSTGSPAPIASSWISITSMPYSSS